MWVVGKYQNAGIDRSLIEHWDGTNWVQVPSPNATSYNNELTAATAISATDVWAVGYRANSILEHVDDGLIEHWDGYAGTPHRRLVHQADGSGIRDFDLG